MELRRQRRSDPKANPWTLEAVARRDESRGKLAQALRRIDVDSERAVDVERCGQARVLWDPTAEGWVYGEHGLAVSRVNECGHRICVLCAPRASRRNRKNLLERVAHCDTVHDEAMAGTLAPKAAIAVAGAVADTDAVARLFDGVDGGMWGTVATQTEGDVFAVLDAHRLRVVEGYAKNPHLGAAAARSFALRARTYGGVEHADVLDSLFGGDDVDKLGHEHIRAGVMRSRTSKAQKKAEKAQRRARAREDAARALDAADSLVTCRRLALVLLQKLERLDADVRLVVGEWLEGPKPVGPLKLHTRDLERVPGQLERAARGDDRAVRSLELQDHMARRRWSDALDREMRDAAVELAKDARRHFRNVVGRYEGRVEYNPRTKAGADFVGHLVQTIRDRARKAAAASRLWRSRDVRFLTLTQSADHTETATEALERVRSSLNRFTRLAAWRDHAAGAIIKVEVERSTQASRRAKALRLLDDAERLEASGMVDDAAAMRTDGHGLLRRLKLERERKAPSSWWHAHAHIAVSCGFWPVDDIRAAWVTATRGDGSCGVDIQRPRRGVTGVLDELSKYITKPVGLARLSVDEVAELARAISGRRLLRCTGALRGLELEDLEHERTKETTEGELSGDVAADGVVGFVDDDTSALGRRAVYLDDAVDADGNVVERRKGIWREDAAAQEERRRRLELAHEHHRARRIRGDVELPET